MLSEVSVRVIIIIIIIITVVVVVFYLRVNKYFLNSYLQRAYSKLRIASGYVFAGNFVIKTLAVAEAEAEVVALR